jgi:hypothetical protein
MYKLPKQNILPIFVAVISLLVATIALYVAHSAKELALSEITVEEQNSLTTPIFDQQTNSWGFVALYELAISNQSGPAVVLETVAKAEEGSGFIVPLNGETVLDIPLENTAFVLDNSIEEIKSNPRLLKDLTKNDMGQYVSVNITLENGESKAVRFGLSLKAYDKSNEPLAQVVLISFKLFFSNGKTYTFRRGFPIPSLKPTS